MIALPPTATTATTAATSPSASSTNGALPPDRAALPDNVVGLVLAGGEGRRMGGQDKGLLEYHGTPLALHAARRLGKQVGSVLISANRHLGVYRGFGYPVVQDTLPGFNGPLAGILAALEHLAARSDPAEFLMVVPCDTPDFPTDLTARLQHGLIASGAAIALAEAGGRRHYACTLLRTALATNLAAYLASGGRSIRGWHELHSTAVVIFPNQSAFANLNSAEALEDSGKR